MLKWKCLLFAFILCSISLCVQAQQFEMMHDGITRTYVVYEPNNLEPNQKGYPLVIGLHGTGADGITQIGTAGFISKANSEKFIVACPDALSHGAYTYFNAGDGYEELTNGTDDIGFISALIDKMIADYNIDTTRVYVMGFSNGSAMTYRVAAQLSHKVAAVGTVSGQMCYEFEKCNPEYPVPIMHIHGLADPLLPFEGKGDDILHFPPTEDVLEFWGKINNCYSNPYTILDTNEFHGKKWTSFDGKDDIILYTIEDWGHHWPRKGDPGLDATDLIWEFLKTRRRVIETDSNDWYVDPNGNASGDGSQENPWDLITAFSHESIRPGDTVWLNGGIYTGPFTKDSNLAGTEYAPIKYRAIPDQRVTFTTNDPDGPVLTNNADYVWFWGIEVTFDHFFPVTVSGVSCIEQSNVSGAKYINIIFHDLYYCGGLLNTRCIGAEFTGCISYNNYKGFYFQNGPNDVNDSVEDLPWLRYYDCIAFDNIEAGFGNHLGPQLSIPLANILHRGCVSYGNGSLGNNSKDVENVLIGDSQYDDNFVMQECFTYSPPELNNQSTALWGSMRSPLNGRVIIEDNIFVGGDNCLRIESWDQVNFQGNICYAPFGYLLNINSHYNINKYFSDYILNYNSYYQGSGEFCYLKNTHYDTLESWQAATGWDANSIQISRKPDTAWIDVRVNKYEPDRAHLIVYNWPESETFVVDINDLWPEDAILEQGQGYYYKIVSVEDIWGEPLSEGFFGDGEIILPMEGKYAPEFTCYIITREIMKISAFFK